MMNKLAANIPIAPDGGFTGLGILGKPNGSQSVNTFAKIISTTIGIMTIVAFIWFAFILITGALGVMGSGGDQKALESSKKKISNGLVGLIVVIASIFILDLLGEIIGVNFLTIGQLLYFVTK